MGNPKNDLGCQPSQQPQATTALAVESQPVTRQEWPPEWEAAFSDTGMSNPNIERGYFHRRCVDGDYSSKV